VLFFYREDLEAIIELKFGRGEDGQDKLLTDLAKKALNAINAKDYGSSLLSNAKEAVKIGVGVTTRGKCLALVGDL
jgi:hypothetical protein